MRRSVPLSRSGVASVAEPAATTLVYDEVDVLVVGGGPAGVGAATAAARTGMRTLLVERYGCLGGIWTAGLLNPFFDARGKGGVTAEILDRLDEYGGTDAVHDWRAIPQFGTTVFNYEAMKVVLDQMVAEAGARVLLYTYAVGALMDGNRIRGVIVENKSGRSAVLAGVVVDCTGDGDVAYHAGCDFELGRESDGLLQPMTLQFMIGGLDYEIHDRPSVPLYEVLERFNTPAKMAAVPYKPLAAVPVPGLPGSAAVMWTHMHRRDGTAADDLTDAVIEGRRQVQRCMELLNSARDQIGEVRLLETAMQVGVRETRRIVGEYRLDLEDLIVGRDFDDTICRVTFNVDIHLPDGNEIHTIDVQPYGIPYRSLVPKGVDQLLVAGRCISGSHEAHASYRVTGNCVAMGEAAGAAAALAVESGVPPRDLDGRDVRALVERAGARL